MIALIVASPEGQVGKTVVSAGLLRRMLSEGRKAGYFRPFSLPDSGGLPSAGQECRFLQAVLELHESAEAMCPLSLPPGELSAALGAADKVEAVRKAFGEVSRDKDVVVVESPAGLGPGGPASRLMADVLGQAAGSLLVILQYSAAPLRSSLSSMDSGLKKRAVGVVVNAVPASRMAEVKGPMSTELDLPVLGVLPQDRSLMGITVNELAGAAEARVVTPWNGTSELIENVMIGAATVDHGPLYYSRKQNKAVVVRAERPDMQLAALETQTKCLVLTGGGQPISTVVKQAEARKVPILVTGHDTQTALSRIEAAIRHSTISSEQKLRKIDELMGQSFDFKKLYKGIGLG